MQLMLSLSFLNSNVSKVPEYGQSVQSPSHVQLFVNPWNAVHKSSLFITNTQNVIKLMSIESVMPSNHLILQHPVLLLPSIFPSTRVFSRELALHMRWPKHWTCSFSPSPSNECTSLVSFRIDWFDLLAVQETLKSLLQHHSLKASFLHCSVFFIVHFWHPYMTTVKNIALTIWNLLDKVMSLLFNVLFRFVIDLLQRNKCLCFLFFFSPCNFIHWRLITLQYCSGFCHTLTWISHGFTCIPHPDPPSCLPLYLLPLGLPSAPALTTHLMHPTWAGDLSHPW